MYVSKFLLLVGIGVTFLRNVTQLSFFNRKNPIEFVRFQKRLIYVPKYK